MTSSTLEISELKRLLGIEKIESATLRHGHRLAYEGCVRLENALAEANRKIAELEAVNTINTRTAAEIVAACAKACRDRFKSSPHKDMNWAAQECSISVLKLSPIAKESK